MGIAVDVVVVTRNTREMTLSCVRSIVESRSPELELACMVVDNASGDGTADAIERDFPEVGVLRNDHNARLRRVPATRASPVGAATTC